MKGGAEPAAVGERRLGGEVADLLSRTAVARAKRFPCRNK
jgi:hypothetical protein